MRTTTTYEAFAGNAPAARAEYATTAANAVRCARNVCLFAAAPFIGLVYVVALPFVGLALLAWMAVKAACKPAAA